MQATQKELTTISGILYFDNNLVISKADDSLVRADRVTCNFD